MSDDKVVVVREVQTDDPNRKIIVTQVTQEQPVREDEGWLQIENLTRGRTSGEFKHKRLRITNWEAMNLIPVLEQLYPY